MKPRKKYDSSRRQHKNRDDIKRMFGEEKLTLEEIAKKIGLTRERVRQIVTARWPELIVQRNQERREQQIERALAKEDARVLLGIDERQRKRAERRKLVIAALKAGKPMSQVARETGESMSKLSGVAQALRRTGKIKKYLRFSSERKEVPLWAEETKRLLTGEGKNWTRAAQALKLKVGYNALSMRVKRLRELGMLDPVKKKIDWEKDTIRVVTERTDLSRKQQAEKLKVPYNTLQTRINRLIARGLITEPEKIFKKVRRVKR